MRLKHREDKQLKGGRGVAPITVFRLTQGGSKWKRSGELKSNGRSY